MIGIGNQVAMGKMLETGQHQNLQYGAWGNQGFSNVNNWNGVNIGYSADFPVGLNYGFGSLTTAYPAAMEKMNITGAETSMLYGQMGNNALNTVSHLMGTQLPMVADHPFGTNIGYAHPTPQMGYNSLTSVANNFMGYPTQFGVAQSPTLGIGQRLPSYTTSTFDNHVAASYNPFTSMNNYYQAPAFMNFGMAMAM